MARDRRKDRRVQRTERLLHDALSSLIHEKGYDAIAVKEILARADVGRSTFYTHFRGKDELLASGIRDMVGARRPAPAPAAGLAERVLRFSLPVLTHIASYRPPNGMAPGLRRQAVVHEHLEHILAELIAFDLRSAAPRQDESAGFVPDDLLARHVAATFVLVVEWWMDRPGVLSVSQADGVFRALVHPVVEPRQLVPRDRMRPS